jgi:hypothetical protein
MNDELWIDLQSLISCSSYDEGFLTIYYQYNENHKEPADDTITYCLRKALRAVGRKITRVETYYNDDYECVMKSYYTSVTKEEGEYSCKLWNDYVGETFIEP